MNNVVQMMAQQGVEEFYDEVQYEAERDVELQALKCDEPFYQAKEAVDPYAGINSCDALRIIDGVVDDGLEDARGISECMESMSEKGLL